MKKILFAFAAKNYFYDAKVGEAQTYSTQPISLIILDKKYADKTIVIIR